MVRPIIPTFIQVKEFRCPKCGAKKGEDCNRETKSRRSHQIRIDVAKKNINQRIQRTPQ